MIQAAAVLLLAALAAAQERPERLTGPEIMWKDLEFTADLKGWTRLPIPADAPLDSHSQWHVEKNGVLVCKGTGGHEWLRYDKELGDFILQVEWRFTNIGEAKYNSGVFVRNSAGGLVWHQAQTGARAGGYLFGNTLIKGVPQRFNLREQIRAQRVRPAGEWNRFEIHAAGRKIALRVNGALTSEFAECEVPRGYIGLEAEGYRIEFRNLRLWELGR